MQDQTSILNSERDLIFQIKLQGYSSIPECDCRCYLSSAERIGTCLLPKPLCDSVTRHPCDRNPQEPNRVVCPKHSGINRKHISQRLSIK